MQDISRSSAARLVARVLAALALALTGPTLTLVPVVATTAAVAHAQAVDLPPDDTAPPPADAAAAPGTASDAGAAEAAPAVAGALFLQVVDPAAADVEVALEAATISILGLTAPGAVVSVDGLLADVADDGGFHATVDLDEGANEISVVASDADGNVVEQTLYLVRG